MSVERPTFSESWYRVADQRPRLRTTVQVSRQSYRGEVWHVVQDTSNNQFFRLSQPDYHFVGMLDGRRTVADAWQTCLDELEDEAPTQNEVIQLLGQLYTSNLLYADLPVDTASMFRRRQKRVAREVRGYLMNLLFVRIPLFDPNRLLDRWVGVLGHLFSWFGLVLWLLLMGTGVYFLAGREGALIASASAVLNTDNLLVLYLSFALIKVAHEFAHGFACKKFGLANGSGGEVHTIGVMFLVFTPVPYVDASSAWAFPSKWQRIVVAAAGMMAELAIAAVSAVVWANTAEGTMMHGVSYNIIFIASVSTLLFNGNPLLRYDGYFILSDLLEVPNLAQRSKDFLYYLVKRYVWGVRRARNTARTTGARGWLISYAISSTVYRIIICVGILLFVADRLFFVGAGLAIAAIITWVIVPAGKFVRFLATSSELAKVRSRAVGTTAMAVAAFAVTVGLIRVPDRARAEGVVEPEQIAIIHVAADGFIDEVLFSGAHVDVDGPVLVTTHNPQLLIELRQLVAERQRLSVRRRLALNDQDVAVAQMCMEQLAALQRQILRAEDQIDALVIRAPFEGIWVAPEIDRALGAYVHHGDKIGIVAALDTLVIRATASQDTAAMLFAEARERVEIRIRGRPDIDLTGTIMQIFPAGSVYLPSAALGYAAGGSVEVDADDRNGTRASEPFFEIRIRPEADVRLLPGQRTVVRFTMQPKPLGMQWWESLCRLFQRRFHI